MNLARPTPASKQLSFLVFVVGVPAETIAGGDLAGFTEMLRAAGELRRPPVVATAFPWSSWTFSSWWAARRFQDFLVDEHWHPEVPEADFWLDEVAKLEPVAA